MMTAALSDTKGSGGGAAGGGGTDACLAGAVLLTRVIAMRPRACDRAAETFRQLVEQLLPVAAAMSQVGLFCT
jgi:hypothetical protein